MKKPLEQGKPGFHEMPLVLFTALVIAGAGLAGSQMVFGFLTWLPWIPVRGVMGGTAGLLVLGLGISTLHLGRPFRAHRALTRVGRSPLSNEVLILGSAAAFSTVAFLMPQNHDLLAPVAVGAMAFSLLSLVAVGRVYHLPGQLTWSGPTVFQPLVLGLGWGLTFLLGNLDAGARARGELIILLVYAVDGLLVWERMRRLGRALARGLPARPGLMRYRGPSLGLRVTLGVLVPAVALTRGMPELAAVVLLGNLVLDRFLFYGLAVRSSTEAELMRVEAALLARCRSPGDPPSSASIPVSAEER